MKRIDMALADTLANEFADKHKLSSSDWVVRRLRRGLKLSLGKISARKAREAQKAAMQPNLFADPLKTANVTEFPSQAVPDAR